MTDWLRDERLGDRLLGLRDIAGVMEHRPLDREYAVSTIVTPHGRAKCLANQTELVAAMTRAAMAEHGFMFRTAA